jgi:hypothetical protein
MNRDRSSRAGLRSVAGRAQRRLHLETLEDRSLCAADAMAALTDDAYEQNDTRATATNLGTLTATKTLNNLVQADAADWYKFNITSAATTGSSVTLGFTHAQGDLDLELFNAAGTRVKVSQGIGNSEAISLAGVAAGTYYVRVFGYRGTTNPNYSLGIKEQAGCRRERQHQVKRHSYHVRRQEDRKREPARQDRQQQEEERRPINVGHGQSALRPCMAR